MISNKDEKVDGEEKWNKDEALRNTRSDRKRKWY